MAISTNAALSMTEEEATAYLIAWLRSRLEQRPKGDGRSLEPHRFDLYSDLLTHKLRLYPIDPRDSKIVNEKLTFGSNEWDAITNSR